MILLLASVAIASPQSLYEEGVEHMGRGDQRAAAAAFSAALQEGGPDPAVYHALGNALYRQGAEGHALAAWQRGLYLSPFDEDIRYNIALQGSSHQPAFPVRWGLWLLFASLSSALCVLYARGRSARAAIGSALAASLLSSLLLLHAWHVLSKGFMVQDSVARSAVGGAGASLFTVPQGSLVEVLQEYGAEVQVLYGERKGWVPGAVVTPLDPEAPFSIPPL